MKAISLLLLSAVSHIAAAQNVGIGTSTPTKKLHVVGTTRTDTLSIGTSAQRASLNFQAQLGEKISFWDDGTANGPLYGIGLQSGLLQIHSYSAVDDIGFGYGTSQQFIERVRFTGSGNVGINTSYPQTYGHVGSLNVLELRNPGAAGANMQSLLVLSSQSTSGSLGGINWASTALPGEKRTAYIGSFFENAAAAKLSFYTRNSGGSLLEKMVLSGEGALRLEGPNALGKGDAFSVGGFGDVDIDAPGTAGGRFTIKEGGNVGINRSNPSYRLDVNGDLNLSGSIRGNGNAGFAGQVLTSSGNGGVPTWGSATNQMYNLTNTYTISNGGFTTVGNDSWDLPGLTQTLVLQQTSKVIVSMHMAGRNTVCAFCTDGVMRFFIYIDNVAAPFMYKECVDAADGFNEDSGIRMTTLGAGVHTFKMRAFHISGADVALSADNYLPGTSMTLVVIPQ